MEPMANHLLKSPLMIILIFSKVSPFLKSKGMLHGFLWKLDLRARLTRTETKAAREDVEIKRQKHKKCPGSLRKSWEMFWHFLGLSICILGDSPGGYLGLWIKGQVKRAVLAEPRGLEELGPEARELMARVIL